MIAEQPLVSILTPSLNQAAFVEDCLASIDCQDYPRIEQIIVDGGSTDGTLELLRARAGDDRRVLELPGSSQTEALNAAFADAHGEIIGWLNTDDAFFTTDAVSTALARFAEDPDALVVYGDAVAVDEEGRVLQHISVDDRRLGRMQICSPFCQPAVFFRREAVDGLFLRDDLDLAMDYELWLRLHRKGKFSKVPRILAIDRAHTSAKSLARWKEMPVELDRLATEYGVPYDRRPLPFRAASRWWRRALGVAPLMTIERRYSLAYRGRIDSRWRRVVRQVALPHRLLHRL